LADTEGSTAKAADTENTISSVYDPMINEEVNVDGSVVTGDAALVFDFEVLFAEVNFDHFIKNGEQEDDTGTFDTRDSTSQSENDSTFIFFEDPDERDNKE
jgi:hypothetical protein